MESMRTLRVTGKGQIKVKPDVTRITMTLTGLRKEYAKTLEASSTDTEQLKEVLKPFGFESIDVKTLRFNVDTEYESYQERNQWKQRFVGYKYDHVMKIEFDSDNDRLGRILYALAHALVQPELRISYTVKDQEAAKNLLLGKAVEDAMAKAAVLASAAGVSLKEIQSIDYSWGTINFEVQPMARNILCDAKVTSEESYDMDIEPDDIEVSDTVTVVWDIA